MAEGACYRAAEGVQTRHGKGKHTGDGRPDQIHEQQQEQRGEEHAEDGVSACFLILYRSRRRAGPLPLELTALQNGLAIFQIHQAEPQLALLDEPALELHPGVGEANGTELQRQALHALGLAGDHGADGQTAGIAHGAEAHHEGAS